MEGLPTADQESEAFKEHRRQGLGELISLLSFCVNTVKIQDAIGVILGFDM